jgi:hypothetical protein
VFFRSVYKSNLANGWRGDEADDMTGKNDSHKTLEPPVITEPLDGAKPGARFVVKGTATPGSTVRAFSTKDSLNPLFGQHVGPSGDWLTFIDLRQFGFYVVEVAPDGEISPRSPVVTIHLESTAPAPHNDVAEA